MKLSVLIPTTPDRQTLLDRLYNQFKDQLEYTGAKSLEPYMGVVLDVSFWKWTDAGNAICCEVEVIIFSDFKTMTVGKKRNILKDYATGEYLNFIDSDDRIADNYFDLILTALRDFELNTKSKPDACSLKGIITENGRNPLLFEHSIKYRAYKTNPEGMPVRYERYPNHLNTIRSDIAKRFTFPEKNHGEDSDFADQLFQSGLIRNEAYIEDILYYYEWMKK